MDASDALTDYDTDENDRAVLNLAKELQKIPVERRSLRSGSKSKGENDSGEDSAMYQLTQKFLLQLRTMDKKLDQITNKQDELIATIISQENIIKNLKEDKLKQDSRITFLEGKFDDMEQLGLSNKLLLFSDEINSNARDLKAHVVSLMNTHFDLGDEFFRSVSVNKFGKGSKCVLLNINDGARVTEVKATLFTKFKLKRSVQNVGRSVRFSVNEFLTKRRNALLGEIRRKKLTDTRICTVFAFHGKIYVKKKENGPKLLVNSMSSLNELLECDD